MDWGCTVPPQAEAPSSQGIWGKSEFCGALEEAVQGQAWLARR